MTDITLGKHTLAFPPTVTTQHDMVKRRDNVKQESASVHLVNTII